MHRADKTPEPSMEEILASIRKIIAEEPIGSRPGPEPRETESDRQSSTGGSGRQANEPTLSIPSRNEDHPEEPPYTVEDALADLMDDPSQRRPGRPAGKDDLPKPQARPAGEEESRPSWLFGRQTSPPAGASQSPGAIPAGSDRRQGGGLLGHLGQLRETPERAAGEGEVSSPKPSTGSPRPLEAGSLFERQREGGRPGPADFPSLPQVQSQDVPRPSAPRVPTREATIDRRADEGHGLMAPGAGSAGAKHGSPAPMARSPEPAPDRPIHPQTPARAPIAEAERKPEERQRPAPTAADGLVRQEKAVPAPSADHPGGEGPQREKLAEGAKTVAQNASPASGNAQLAPSQAPQAVQPAAARTLEDTVADLLRPLLREWLDANMPRIVEKALRVELAASAKRPEIDSNR
ncbi:MAG TPA: DUF2497 domain-containing protein [Hyphomicrobiaceae bacterium]